MGDRKMDFEVEITTHSEGGTGRDQDRPVWPYIIYIGGGTGWQSPPARLVVPARGGLASAALYRVPVRQTGPCLSAHAGVPEAGGHHLKLPTPPALESHMGVFPFKTSSLRHSVFGARLFAAAGSIIMH